MAFRRGQVTTAEPGVTQQNCRAVERVHVICESGLNPVDGYFNGLLSAIKSFTIVHGPIARGVVQHASELSRLFQIKCVAKAPAGCVRLWGLGCSGTSGGFDATEVASPTRDTTSALVRVEKTRGVAQSHAMPGVDSRRQPVEREHGRP